MKLAPKDPPGRSTRRARGYAAEIGLLRAQGYTFASIRKALAEVGITVSKSTVQREMARLAAAPRSGSAATPAPAPHAPAAPTPNPAPPGSATDTRSGREIAEAFTASQNSNPLFRHRSPS